MTLGQLIEKINALESADKYAYTLSDPFSWRGSYCEVCFSIEKAETPVGKEELLRKANLALAGVFYGYKGGTYTYDLDTKVNFEKSFRSYTDGGYAKDKVVEISVVEPMDIEEQLVYAAFPPRH